MAIVAVSDVHLGFKLCKKDNFNSFLDWLRTREDVKHLVICGDFLDMWRRDLAGVILENAETLSKLQNLQPKIKVHYVAGNHDHHVRALKNFDYQFEFSKELSLAGGDVAYRFLHGYEFDPTQNPLYFDALCYTTDELDDILSEAWKIFTSEKKWWERVFSFIVKGKAMGEMERMLTKPKERLKDIIDVVEKNACQAVKENEVLLFGHTHEPFINKKENVANCGSWQSDTSPPNTYVEIKDEKIALKVFKGGDII